MVLFRKLRAKLSALAVAVAVVCIESRTLLSLRISLNFYSESIGTEVEIC